MIGFFIILFHILGLISSIHSVMSTRTSQGTIAWLIALNTFPYIAVPAYWILGRSRFQGYVKAHQVNDRSLEQYEKMLDEIWPRTVFRRKKFNRPDRRLRGLPTCPL